MTELLERAIEAVRRLPSAWQDDAAQMLLLYAKGEDLYVLSAAETEALDRSDAAAVRGEFATDAEIEAIWARHGL